MLRFISMGILAMLLCSCIQKQPSGRSVMERIAEYEEECRLWDKKFKQLPGTHLSGLTQAWGEPEKLKNNEYRWRRDNPIQGGGYSEPDGHTSSKVYKTTSTGVAKHVGYIDTPKERYVEPWTLENWCEIRVTTNKKGIITRASYDGDGSGSTRASGRAALFPLP